MDKKQDTAGIIERLEAASGPDREIDGAIALCINPEAKLWTPEWWSGGRDEYLLWPDPKPGVARYEQVEHYTSSIDSALSLVPEGWRYGFEQAGMFDGSDLCEAWLWPFEDSFEPDWRNGDQGYRSCENAKRGAHKLPAISICIAALKAREEQ